MATSHDGTSSRSLLSNVGFGIAWGLGMAFVFSLLVGMLALLRGSDWNPRYQVSTLAVIRGYFLAGLVGGAVFGLLRPLAQSRLGAAIVGVIVGPFVYGAIATTVAGQPHWADAAAIIPGVLVGGASGWIWGKPGALP